MGRRTVKKMKRMVLSRIQMRAMKTMMIKMIKMKMKTRINLGLVLAPDQVNKTQTMMRKKVLLLTNQEIPKICLLSNQ